MQLIIFDIDGTLANTDYEEDRCYAEAFEDVVGRSLQGLNYRDCKDITDSAITDHFYQQLYGRNATEQEVEALKQAFRHKLEARHKTHPHLFEEIPGAAALFNRLKSQHDVALGISTGAWKLPASFKLDVINVETEDVVFHGADEDYTKLHSINLVMRDSHQKYQRSEFDRITYIGDRTYDLHTSNQLGIHFIGVDYKQTGVLQQHGVKVVLPDFSEPDAFYNALEIG